MDFAPAVTINVAAVVTIFLQLPVPIACLVILVIPIGTFIVLRQISTQKGNAAPQSNRVLRLPAIHQRGFVQRDRNRHLGPLGQATAENPRSSKSLISWSKRTAKSGWAALPYLSFPCGISQNMFAIVPQIPFLVADTVYHNICYCMERAVSLPEVQEAARRANIASDIEKIPDTYHFMLSAGGRNLSGGQR